VIGRRRAIEQEAATWLRTVFCTMHVTTAREIRLASRPAGFPEPANFEIADVSLEEPAEGQVLVRNTVMSVEPYMRGRMNDQKSYVPPFAIGKALEGGAVGFVVSSKAAALPVGTWVQSQLGWREYALADARAFQKIDTSLAPASAYLGVLGVPGLTAWAGLKKVGELKAGDVVFISSAAGAVGSIAGQIAKLAGATVIGSAGGPEKVAYLKEQLGFDEAFDHKGGNIAAKLAEAAPKGIDLYFENVGGEQLEAAIGALKPFGRIAACGMISGYNDDMPGPRNIIQVVGKRLKMQGFIVIDYFDRIPEFVADIAPLLRSGKIVAPETYFEGLEKAPQAFDSLLRGGTHVGKILVRLAPEGTKP
jgi:NADPH-dependent curcumin reductase CurA